MSLGQSIAPGETRRLAPPVGESVGGEVSTPVIVVAGERPGPVVCLAGGIHGDELNGVEVVRRSVEGAKPPELRGTLVGAPDNGAAPPAAALPSVDDGTDPTRAELEERPD